MNIYIPISMLNDFIFCPYSIYLHNVYTDTDEGLYHAKSQTQGKIAHKSIENKTASNYKSDIIGLSVYSEIYKLMGKIDIYKQSGKLLIERKFQLKQIYQGQIYQLWAQYLCMEEMGYAVEKLAFYEISTNKMIPIPTPSQTDIDKFKSFIQTLKNYDPSSPLKVNPNKCKHCIYCNLCDKTNDDNVYN